MSAEVNDQLDMDYINSLPQPWTGRDLRGTWWSVLDFEVQFALVRIEVGGEVVVMPMTDFTHFRDGDGVEHDSDGFWADATPAERERDRLANRQEDGEWMP